MGIDAIARDVAALAGAGKDEEIAKKYWADDVVSIEVQEPMRVTRGKAEVAKKGEWFVQNHEVHSVKCEGPYVNDTQFALHLTYDLTRKESGQRLQMNEVALYTVKDGKIIEERFFMPATAG